MVGTSVVRAIALAALTLVLITATPTAAQAVPAAQRTPSDTTVVAHPAGDEQFDWREWLRDQERERERRREEREREREAADQPPPAPAEPPAPADPPREDPGEDEAGLGRGERPEPPAPERPEEPREPAEDAAPPPEQPDAEPPRQVLERASVGDGSDAVYEDTPATTDEPATPSPAPTATATARETDDARATSSDVDEQDADAAGESYANNPRVIVAVTLGILVALTAAVGVFHFASPWRRSRH